MDLHTKRQPGTQETPVLEISSTLANPPNPFLQSGLREAGRLLGPLTPANHQQGLGGAQK